MSFGGFGGLLWVPDGFRWVSVVSPRVSGVSVGFGSVSVQFGSVRFRSVRFGSAWLSSALLDSVRFGLVRLGLVRLSEFSVRFARGGPRGKPRVCLG